jgi:hypothetical protein
MSRSDKKPVGFATQLTAGGIAGAMEAVRLIIRFGERSRSSIPGSLRLVMLPTAGHHQSPNATVPFW